MKSKAGAWLRVQFIIFTISVTILSRLFIAGGRLLRRNRLRIRKRGTYRVRTTFPSGSNVIDAKLVQPVSDSKTAVLICHGIGETIWHWKGVQRLLAQNGVASLMFSYSGWGRSTGMVDVRQCEADAVAAWDLLQQLLPDHRLSLLGYSLGSGIATRVAPELQPHRLFLCAAYTSLRDGACRMGFPRFVTRLLPPVWNNMKGLRRVTVPTLVLHGRDDGLFPPRMAESLASVAVAPTELVMVPGQSHARPIFAPELAFWSHVIDRT